MYFSFSFACSLLPYASYEGLVESVSFVTVHLYKRVLNCLCTFTRIIGRQCERALAQSVGSQEEYNH